MARTPKRIGPTALTSTATTIFTAATNTIAVIRYIHCVAGAVGTGTLNNLSLSIGAMGVTANIYSQIGLPGSDQREDGALERFVYIPLVAGEILQAKDNGGSYSATITIGYDEVSI